MSDPAHDPELPPTLSAAACAEWMRHVENVLRGVAHGLNNRSAALAALVELTTEPAEQPAVLREILNTEQQRVRQLAHALRVVSAQGGMAEALLPADVMEDVSAVFEQHPELRDGAIEVDATNGTPIRMPRSAFARTLLALAAGLAGGTRASPRRLVITTEGDWLTVAAEAVGAETSTLALELARHHGGGPLDGRYGIRLPTLAALRRREGR